MSWPATPGLHSSNLLAHITLRLPATCPSGTGKTTLAHVVASHCGFRVVEINASDERTAASLTRRITDVAQMQPVLDGGWARKAPAHHAP